MICSAEDLFTLNSNKFRMVYKVDGKPQLDSRDWSMYSNILNEHTIAQTFSSYIQFDCEGYALSDTFYRIEIELLVLSYVQFYLGSHFELP